jgi:hypothetical protein
MRFRDMNNGRIVYCDYKLDNTGIPHALPEPPQSALICQTSDENLLRLFLIGGGLAHDLPTSASPHCGSFPGAAQIFPGPTRSRTHELTVAVASPREHPRAEVRSPREVTLHTRRILWRVYDVHHGVGYPVRAVSLFRRCYTVA